MSRPARPWMTLKVRIALRMESVLISMDSRDGGLSHPDLVPHNINSLMCPKHVGSSLVSPGIEPLSVCAMTLLPNSLWELGESETEVNITKKPDQPLGYGPTITQYTKREIDGVYKKFVRIGYKQSNHTHPTDSQIKHRVAILQMCLMMEIESRTASGVWGDLKDTFNCWVLQDAYDFKNEWTLCDSDMPFPGDPDY